MTVAVARRDTRAGSRVLRTDTATPLNTSSHHTWWNESIAVAGTRSAVNATAAATPSVAPRLRTAWLTADPEPNRFGRQALHRRRRQLWQAQRDAQTT